MLLNLLIGLPVMLICLLLQAFFLNISLRQYARYKLAHAGSETASGNVLLLYTVLLLLTLGYFTETVIWAALFMLLGEFDDFRTALYHSGVNFVTLGYGDVVMSARWRLLGPLEAANGILMFGLSTAVMTAAVLDIINQNKAKMKKRRRRWRIRRRREP
ncbi:ion channel [Dyella kyungheensis]|uniref:ion channel n=1 Tax=Dyella kyungheensis TaxID=1242174 RepID=UPI003CF2F626